MPSPRENECAASLPDSLLNWADERERRRIDELMAELRQPETTANPQRPEASDGDEVVAKTRADAARLLGVDERTLSKWAADPTFPGKAGTAGQRNGHFPIGAIRAWRQQVSGNGEGRATDADPTTLLRLRKLAAETARREVDLEIRLGTLIDREQAETTIAAAIASARSLLEELPEQLAEAFPAARVKLRRIVRRIARRKVLQVLESLADCATEDPDDRDDDVPYGVDGGRRAAAQGAETSAAKPAGSHSGRVGGGAKAKARPVVSRASKTRSRRGK